MIQDVDGDGKNDIASLSTYTNGINFFSNTNPSITLPVTWINFTAQAQKDGIQLHWSTAAESQNSYFEIERSSDADHFSDVGRVPGAQYSTAVQTYSWLDTAELSGEVWYRIRQVNFDLKASYSKIVEVRLGNNFSVSMSPNPVATSLHVKLPVPWNSSEELCIFNMKGQLMLRQSVNGTTADLNCSGWSVGMYVLTLYAGGQRVFSKMFEKK